MVIPSFIKPLLRKPTVYVIGGLVAVAVIFGVLKVTGGLVLIEKKLGIYKAPERPALTLDATLKVATPSYSLRYPSSWGTQQSGITAGIFSKDTGAADASQSVAGVLTRAWLIAEKENSPWQEIVELWRGKIQLSYPGVEILEERSFTLNDKEAYYFEIKYTEGGNSTLQPKKDFQGRSYIIRDGKYLYQLLGSSLTPLWPFYKNTLVAIANSFSAP